VAKSRHQHRLYVAQTAFISGVVMILLWVLAIN